MAQFVSLYRKYRPDNFDKIIGQKHIVTTLINQINLGAISHAYLFTGSRGTGKTSTAKVFAKALNCLNPKNGSPCNECKVCLSLANESNLDVVELDAASNNGVDNIRELREKVQFPPAIAKYRVFIIDEVHMLTTAAFNALLKTLEEPPAHIVFILATTEVNKLPQTILSRCLRFDFRLVSKEELQNHLAKVFDSEKYQYEQTAIEKIAIHGAGSVRDMLSIADSCMSYAPKKLRYEDVLEVLGASQSATLHAIAEAIIDSNIGELLKATSVVYEKGKGIETLNRELSDYFRNIMSAKNIKGFKGSLSEQDLDNILKLSKKCDNYRLARILDILALSENSMRYSSQQDIIFDANLVKAATIYTDLSVDGIISRVSSIERGLKNFEANSKLATHNVVEPQLNQKVALDTSNNVVNAQLNQKKALDTSNDVVNAQLNQKNAITSADFQSIKSDDKNTTANEPAKSNSKIKQSQSESVEISLAENTLPFTSDDGIPFELNEDISKKSINNNATKIGIPFDAPDKKNVIPNFEGDKESSSRQNINKNATPTTNKNIAGVTIDSPKDIDEKDTTHFPSDIVANTDIIAESIDDNFEIYPEDIDSLSNNIPPEKTFGGDFTSSAPPEKTFGRDFTSSTPQGKKVMPVALQKALKNKISLTSENHESDLIFDIEKNTDEALNLFQQVLDEIEILGANSFIRPAFDKCNKGIYIQNNTLFIVLNKDSFEQKLFLENKDKLDIAIKKLKGEGFKIAMTSEFKKATKGRTAEQKQILNNLFGEDIIEGSKIKH